MARRHFAFAILLIGLALSGVTHAAGSSSPSPPATSSNTTENSTPASSSAFNSTTNGRDYSDYEVPMDLAPDGVEVMEDYVPVRVNEGKEDDDELAQPEGDSDNKTNQPKDSDSSSSSYSSSYAVFVVAAGLFLF